MHFLPCDRSDDLRRLQQNGDDLTTNPQHLGYLPRLVTFGFLLPLGAILIVGTAALTGAFLQEWLYLSCVRHAPNHTAA